jgi:hypothetical protein
MATLMMDIDISVMHIAILEAPTQVWGASRLFCKSGRRFGDILPIHPCYG